MNIAPEAAVSISDEGRKLFNEEGKSGKWLSNEELAEIFGEEITDENSTVKFRYGYDEELSSVSSSFKDAFSEYRIGKYAGTGIDYKNIDYSVVDKMLEKYTSLKQDIEASYTEDEKEQRLSELDKAFHKVFEDNIVSPIRGQIESAMSFNNRGTLVYISGSQEFINRYQSSAGEMNGTYKLLEKVNDRLTSLSKQGISQWIAEGNLKNNLHSIVSSIINITGDSGQRAEYASMKW